jgi:ribosomal protein S18 acetylase RimI-like enzyme
VLTYATATDAQRDAFLSLLREEMAAYLDPTLRAMGTTWEEFGGMFRSIGLVRTIFRRKAQVGFVWIEHRGRELHIHGLALEPGFRGQGIGTQALRDLEEEFRDNVDIMELGVHESNPRARELYERLGFRVEKTLPDVGFTVLRKALQTI